MFQWLWWIYCRPIRIPVGCWQTWSSFRITVLIWKHHTWAITSLLVPPVLERILLNCIASFYHGGWTTIPSRALPVSAFSSCFNGCDEFTGVQLLSHWNSCLLLTNLIIFPNHCTYLDTLLPDTIVALWWSSSYDFACIWWFIKCITWLSISIDKTTRLCICHIAVESVPN